MQSEFSEGSEDKRETKEETHSFQLQTKTKQPRAQPATATTVPSRAMQRIHCQSDPREE